MKKVKHWKSKAAVPKSAITGFGCIRRRGAANITLGSLFGIGNNRNFNNGRLPNAINNFGGKYGIPVLKFTFAHKTGYVLSSILYSLFASSPQKNRLNFTLRRFSRIWCL
jgi:hypothetical protein